MSALGAGGMGEVYRARDANLGREVAIKVVTDSLLGDPDRLSRFEREAQLLALLNHPHIATVHGLERSGGTPFLVMELVDGETLARRIAAGGALPIDEALRIARQIADALHAAHEKGIIHRDLKPANIALTADGQVKVLDFGLAKALGSAESGPHDVVNSPTLSLAATQAGVILGTAAYMAPEQAKGKPADKRSDIWAFGGVLYEMLTGRRAFEGDDASDTMAFVLARDPDWSAVPPATPPPIRALLRQCLSKDRTRRLADISTALFLIDALPAIDSAPAASTPARATTRTKGQAAVLAVVASLVGALVTAAVMWTLRQPPDRRVSRLAIAAPANAGIVLGGNDRDVAISLDGSRVAYIGPNGIVYLRAIDNLDPIPLPGLGLPRGLFFSPDGRWLGFFDGGSGTLRKVPVTGGPPIVLCKFSSNPRGATWLDDGTIVFATNASQTGLLQVADGGGEPVVLTTPDPKQGEVDHLWPERSADGRGVLFTITPGSGLVDESQIAIWNAATRMYAVLFKGGTDAHALPDGLVVYAANNTLRAVRVDVQKAEVLSAPVVVLPEVVVTVFGAANFDVAGDGTLVYVPGGAQAAARSLVWVDRQGREEALKAVPPRAYQYVRLSPDGTRIAMDVRDQENDIWTWSFGRETLTRLTFDPAPDRFPVWSADGRRVLFGSDRAGVANVYWQAADGTGQAERLTTGTNLQFPMSVTPDGKSLVFRDSVEIQDLALLPLEGERTPQPLVKTPFSEQNGEVSPGGQWMAYESNDSGQFEVFVRPFPNVDAGRWQVSTGGGTQPVWSRDGRELFYLAPTGGVMSVRVDTGPSWSAAAPVKLFDEHYYHAGGAGGGSGRTYDVSRDGRRFLMIKQGGDANVSGTTLVVVQHWFEELKRLVPVN